MATNKKKKFIIISILILATLVGIFACQKLFITYSKENIVISQSNEWQYSVNKEKKTITLTKYMGSQTNIEIPSIIQIGEKEYIVTTIGENTFAQNQSVESIEIPENVTKIENDAFNGCTKLKKLVMPKSVTSIGENAFLGCESLENINIANEENEEKIYEEEYIEYLQLSEEEKAEIKAIPREEFVSIDALKENKGPIVGSSSNTTSEELPESYNLKNYINVTVEDQGQSGWCWAFASLKALDTNIALNYNLNYNSSEAHLAHMRSYYFGESLGLEDWTVDEIYNTGGSFYDLISYAENRGVGPVLESEIPNTKYALTEANKTKLQQAQKYVRLLNTIYYPNITKEYQEDGTIIYKNGSTTCTEEEIVEFRNTIKKHIMEDGGVYTGLDACPDSGTAYYNSSTAAYYWKGDKSQLTRDMGHAVTIVGWDDTYSKNNFNANQRPANDGAYICLNSWGTSFGKSGYFYISYDDINVEEYLSGVIEAEEIPESIEITKLPVKTEFIQNYEALDLTGGEITITSKKGNKRVVSMLDDNVEVSGFSNKNTGEITLTVKYKYNNWEYWESQFNVKIIAPTATKIEVNKLPTQLDYAKDCEQLDLTGGTLKIIYNDNEEWFTTLSMTNPNIAVTGFDNTALGQNVITVEYEGMTTQFSVTIANIDSIKLTQLPTNNIYVQGDTALSLEGGKIKITYTNLVTRTINTDNVNVIASGFDTTNIGEIEIKLTYFNQSVTFNVEIIKNNFEYTNSGSYITITGYTGEDTEIIIPGAIEGIKVYKIGEDAFSQCSNITSIILPQSLGIIGDSAFGYCKNLVTIELPANLMSIGNRAFEGCSKLVDIQIPNRVFAIGSLAFVHCTSLEKLTIPANITSIESRTFFGCSNLTDVEILGKVTNIKERAFSECSSLTNIIIPQNVTNIGNRAFEYCTRLTNINIPSKVTSLGEYAFYNCNSLESIIIPSSVTSIGIGAFSCCTILKNIDVNDNNNQYCSVDGILFNKNKTSLLCYPSGKELDTYSIPENITSISENAFEGCSNLKSVEIPSSITNISYSSFSGCISLVNVSITSNVKSISARAFRNCSNLKNINIPESITSIGYEAFMGCTKLTNVKIPSSVTNLGTGVFEDCSSLTEVSLNDKVSEIPISLFNGCTDLRYIEIPNGVTAIGTDDIYESGATFGNCINLTGIEIPSTVTSFGRYTFKGCNNLTIYTYSDATEVINYAESKNIPYEIIINPLTSISITQVPNITEYKDGDKFNSEGMIVTAYYQDGTEANITDYSIIDGENLLEGQETVTISYTEQARTRTATQSIDVIPGVLESIEVTTPPKKVDYVYGENFDSTEMVVTATYENGNSKEITEYTIEDGNNLAVGKSSVRISYTENDVTKTVEQPITVSKAQGSITNITDVSKTYDGYEVSNPNFNRVGDGEVTFEWYSIDGETITKIDSAPINAGTYKVKVILAEGTDYKGASAEKEFTISKATYDMSGIDFENASYTYDGTEKKVEISGTLPEGVNVRYENNIVINVGEYNVTAMFTGDSVNYNEIPSMTATLTIEQAQGSISNIQDLSKTYNGVAVAEPTYDKVGDGQVSIGWYKIENEQEISLNEAPTNAGNYKVKVILAEGTNYTGAEAEKEFTISKATYDMSGISFTDATYAYDGTEKSIVISGTLPDGVSVTYKGNTKTDVGQSLATAMFTGDSVNYNEIPNKTAILTISAMQGSISNITDLSKTYDGYQVSNPNFDRVGDGEVTFEWYSIEGEIATKLENAPINAGAYKVKVIMSSTTNYTEAQAEKEFIISKATYDMTGIIFTDVNYTYDGTEKSIVINGTLPEGVVVRYENNTGTNAGEYNATAIFTGDSKNYNTIENKTAKLTIAKAQGNISSISDISKIYDGVEVANPTCEGVGDGQVTIEWYKLEATVPTKLDTAPINAGNYKVKAILAEGTNYIGTEAEKEFTINKATPQYTVPTGLTAIEGKKLSSINLPEGFSWEQDLETSLAQIGENIFTIKYIPQDTNNYNIVTGIEVVVTVMEKPEIDLGDYVETEDEETGKTYIENITQNTTVEQIKEKLASNGTIEIYKGEEKVQDASTKLVTGMEVRITLENNQTISYEAVVRGDITGDGQINDADLLLLARYMVGFEKEREIVTGARLRATDIVKDSIFATDGDLLKLAKVLVGLDSM